MRALEPARLRAARLLCGRLQPFGANRVARSMYPYELGKRDRYEFSVRAKTGSTLTGNTADFHAHPFGVNGHSEWRHWAIALAVCQPGDVIVEIGANVGTETVGFSDIAGPTGRVVAFEPLPAHLARLERALDGLRHGNVRLMPYALSDHEGRDTFAVPPPSRSQGIGHLVGPEERRTGTTSYYDEPVEMELIDVQTRLLDEFGPLLGGLRLIVADAEGSELPILRGARRVIGDRRPIMVLEASQPHQRRAGFEISQLRDELLALDYSAYDIGNLSLTEVKDPNTGPAHGNWFCVPGHDQQLVARVQRYMRRCALSPCLLGLNPLTSPRRR